MFGKKSGAVHYGALDTSMSPLVVLQVRRLSIISNVSRESTGQRWTMMPMHKEGRQSYRTSATRKVDV